MTVIHKELFLSLFKQSASVIIDNRDLLNELDRAIGDFDHGSNMARGFGLALEKLDNFKELSISDILKQVGMVLISNVGGASGPLYGTAFLKASVATAGRESLDSSDLIRAYELIIEGIKQRGQSDRGCKTMLDAIIPAYEAFKAAVEAGGDLKAASRAAADAANEGMAYTKTIIATKGRASYLGERSIGHQDPGATSSALLIKAIADGLADL